MKRLNLMSCCIAQTIIFTCVICSSSAFCCCSNSRYASSILINLSVFIICHVKNRRLRLGAISRAQWNPNSPERLLWLIPLLRRWEDFSNQRGNGLECGLSWARLPTLAPKSWSYGDALHSITIYWICKPIYSNLRMLNHETKYR